MQVDRNTYISKLSRSKAPEAPKRSKFAITDMRQKLANFLYCTTRASTLAPAIILGL